MVEELLERFSAVVSDVCACFMGFKVCLDYFWRENLIWGDTPNAGQDSEHQNVTFL